jgi:hypothetical protein
MLLMPPALPALVTDEALAVAADRTAPMVWTAEDGAARKAASRLADLFTEDELREGLGMLQAPSGDAVSGAVRGRAVVALELAIVLRRSNLRISDASGATLRLIS